MVLFSSLALAWPTQNITLIHPYPPGGLGDRLGREFQVELEKEFGVTVITKFMPGAANAVAINHILNQDNDHHTFLAAFDDFVTSQYVSGTRLYERFTPVSIWMTYPALVYGGPNASIDKFRQQIKDGKTVNIANMGVNSSYHMWTEGLKSDLKINHVFYKGANPIVADIIGGHVEYGTGNLVAQQQLVAEGKLHPIMVSTTRRHPLYKNVPTFKELGFQGDSFEGWGGYVARKDTNPEAIRRMSQALQKVVRNSAKLQEETTRGLQLINLDFAESQKFVAEAIRNTDRLKVQK
jgi:tripartite-type tricarboxylate transporter receptor subunit TctC